MTYLFYLLSHNSLASILWESKGRICVLLMRLRFGGVGGRVLFTMNLVSRSALTHKKHTTNKQHQLAQSSPPPAKSTALTGTKTHPRDYYSLSSRS